MCNEKYILVVMAIYCFWYRNVQSERIILGLVSIFAYLSERDVTFKEKTFSSILFKMATKRRILSPGFVTPCGSVH
jgi:hypothetical protein